MPAPSSLPATVTHALQVVSTALADMADANRQLLEHEKRMQALVTELMHMAQASTPNTAQLMQVQMAMQRENTVFTSISHVLKTRHDTAKNSIANVR